MCKDSVGEQYAERFCAGRKPRSTKKCEEGICPTWHASNWGTCSTTCGPGVKAREVECLGQKKQKFNESLCAHLTKPDDNSQCQIRKCGRFYWKNSHWSKCSATCGQGVKVRAVACALMATKRIVHPRYCPKAYRPKARQLCTLPPCSALWVTSEWHKCTESCGEGLEVRNVSCRQVSQEGWLLPSHSVTCNMTHPPLSERLCNLGHCHVQYHWKTHDWTPCSRTCGFGLQSRKVLCVDDAGNRTPPGNCLQHYRPDTKMSCYNGPCYATSCKHLKSIAAVDEDGEYRLLINNQLRMIYCDKMHSSNPEEYLTLPAGQDENFSEVFDKRLRRPNSCRVQTSNNEVMCDDCYRNSTYSRAGHTAFTRIRLNVTSLSIIGKDHRFSVTQGRRKIPFASSGDCYSSTQHCPKGVFHVNLTGTGFRVAMNNTWYNYGYKTVSRISIAQAGLLVQGLCGGHCGVCTPDVTGLRLEVNT